MTTVTLLIFSGRHDPKWELSAGEVAALTPLLEGLRSALELSTLGYRGFLVQSDDPGMPREVVVHSDPELECFLLRTGEGKLSPEVIGIVAAATARD